ncbi:transposase family protein [Streptomyces sp. NPDC058614]|uniref:transposase family protein n=1 Tax=Streptomyces sp. NPDC058614 TaxID=3346557 RepID=UPI0036553A05
MAAKPPVDRFRTEIIYTYREFRTLVYPSAIDLSTVHLRFLTHHPAAHRRQTGCRRRPHVSGRQALLVRAHLRCENTYARLSAGFGTGLATAYRYVREAVEVLATPASSHSQVMLTARRHP